MAVITYQKFSTMYKTLMNSFDKPVDSGLMNMLWKEIDYGLDESIIGEAIKRVMRENKTGKINIYAEVISKINEVKRENSIKPESIMNKEWFCMIKEREIGKRVFLDRYFYFGEVEDAKIKARTEQALALTDKWFHDIYFIDSDVYQDEITKHFCYRDTKSRFKEIK